MNGRISVMEKVIYDLKGLMMMEMRIQCTIPTKIANSLQIHSYCRFEEGLPIEYSEYHIKSLALIIPAPPFIFAAIYLTVEHSL